MKNAFEQILFIVGMTWAAPKTGMSILWREGGQNRK